MWGGDIEEGQPYAQDEVKRWHDSLQKGSAVKGSLIKKLRAKNKAKGERPNKPIDHSGKGKKAMKKKSMVMAKSKGGMKKKSMVMAKSKAMKKGKSKSKAMKKRK